MPLLSGFSDTVSQFLNLLKFTDYSDCTKTFNIIHWVIFLASLNCGNVNTVISSILH